MKKDDLMWMDMVGSVYYVCTVHKQTVLISFDVNRLRRRRKKVGKLLTFLMVFCL